MNERNCRYRLRDRACGEVQRNCKRCSCIIDDDHYPAYQENGASRECGAVPAPRQRMRPKQIEQQCGKKQDADGHRHREIVENEVNSARKSAEHRSVSGIGYGQRDHEKVVDGKCRADRGGD